MGYANQPPGLVWNKALSANTSGPQRNPLAALLPASTSRVDKKPYKTLRINYAQHISTICRKIVPQLNVYVVYFLYSLDELDKGSRSLQKKTLMSLIMSHLVNISAQHFSGNTVQQRAYCTSNNDKHISLQDAVLRTLELWTRTVHIQYLFNYGFFEPCQYVVVCAHFSVRIFPTIC